MSFTFFSSMSHEIFKFLPAINLAQYGNNPLNKSMQKRAEFVLLSRRDASAIPYQKNLLKKIVWRARALKNHDTFYLRKLCVLLYEISKHTMLEDKSRLHAIAALNIFFKKEQTIMEDIFTEFENNLNYATEHNVSVTLIYIREFTMLFSDSQLQRLITPLLEKSTFYNDYISEEAIKCLVSFIPRLKPEQYSFIREFFVKNMHHWAGRQSMRLFSKLSAPYFNETLEQTNKPSADKLMFMGDQNYSLSNVLHPLTCFAASLNMQEIELCLEKINKLDMYHQPRAIHDRLKELDRIINDNQVNEIIRTLLGKPSHFYEFPETLFECFAAFLPRISGDLLKELTQNVLKYLEDPNPGVQTSALVCLRKLIPYFKKEEANFLVTKVISSVAKNFNTVVSYQLSFLTNYLTDEQLKNILKQIISHHDFAEIFAKNAVLNDHQETLLIEFIITQSKKFLPSVSELLIKFSPKFKSYNINILSQMLIEFLTHEDEEFQLTALDCLKALDYSMHCDDSTFEQLTNLLCEKLNGSGQTSIRAFDVISNSAPRFDKQGLNFLQKIFSGEFNKLSPSSNSFICLQAFAPYFTEDELLTLTKEAVKYLSHGSYDTQFAARKCVSAVIPFLSHLSLEILLKEFDNKAGNIRCSGPIYIKGFLNLFKEIKPIFDNEDKALLQNSNIVTLT